VFSANKSLDSPISANLDHACTATNEKGDDSIGALFILLATKEGVP